ncbi:putative Hsp20/alpha crystallin family protein [Candidatus Nitrosotalea okcheonensis]|uniref:Putative Hsp20/alpha crystallin family protein n=2 Tax=Candidatus Nitrosotalea okcheonensis TaxID=1903276 RepID=A0A2H1FGU0_9ARCH|nr:archaeal heat shock protein Hsp14 [Candidatus Nitrosotalea okcheonensis]SMH71985.1 putative Hsp20/alpha crystallin family protein [Candidatus Nitrosotalea okcheonensis]
MGIGYYMVKEVMKEIGNKSREFYEFILPPVDMILQNDSLVVAIDMPGFDKKEIKLRLNGNILSIVATREDEVDGTVIWRQRPRSIDKKIKLPIEVKDDDNPAASAKYRDGVLTLTIPTKTGKNIAIE